MDKIFKKSDTNIHVSTDQTVIFYKETETKFIKFKTIPMEKKKPHSDQIYFKLEFIFTND